MIVPLAVIDELDKKKYARRGEFQQRARELLLTMIDRYETAAPDAYVQLREGVTFEVLPLSQAISGRRAQIRQSWSGVSSSRR